jgi:hypothetical protein
MIANQIAGLLTGGVAASLTDYESIQTVSVGAGGSSTISFTSIPTSYSHLQLRFIAAGTSTPVIALRFNSDSGANYVRHRLQGTGAAAQASANTGETSVTMFGSAGLPTASTFGASVLDVLDSANTNKYKTVRALDGVDTNGAGTIEFLSSLWMNTAAITSITLTLNSGNFSQYSSFALYGIK